MSTWRRLLRPDLLELRGYEHAHPSRDAVRLHANELPVDDRGESDGINRYPLPDSTELLTAMADYYGCHPDECLPTRGSDDAIDLLVRAFCRETRDSILICPPTFGIYASAARLQGAGIVEAPARRCDGFKPDLETLTSAAEPGVHLTFLCSPNNPTGVAVDPTRIVKLAQDLRGRSMVVVDEAYLEFTDRQSLIAELAELGNLVVLRTLSKAFGLAGIRCGVLVGRADLVEHLRRLMPPYPLPAETIRLATGAFEAGSLGRMRERVLLLRDERERVAARLAGCRAIARVWPSEGNFLLVEPAEGFRSLADTFRGEGVLVREIGGELAGTGSLRVTIGQPEENARVLSIAESVTRPIHA